MATLFEAIDDHMAQWIARQPMFFVGSAPLAADGHVNISPKGPISTLRVLGPKRVAYLELSGSGAETTAHVRENGRIVVMFCAYEGPPRIVRLHGTGTIHWPADSSFAEIEQEAGFESPTIPQGTRAIIEVDVTRVADSCGYGVPLMDNPRERPHFNLSKLKRQRVMGDEAMVDFQIQRNAQSIDGLPAVDPAGYTNGRTTVNVEP